MRKVLWLILIISTIFSIPLISLRITNEINNTSVLLAYDYQKFILDSKASSQINFSDLRKYGITGVILGEESLGDSFDEINWTLIEELNSCGLQVVLNLNSLFHSKNYYRNLESIVQKYNVRYLLLYDSQKENSTAQQQNGDIPIDELRSLIIRNDLIFFVMENQEQTGYMPILGMDSLITDTNYSLNRAFTLSNHIPKITEAQDATMMWLRAVMDRNIRLVCIEPILPQRANTSNNNFLEVLEASKELSGILKEKGFIVNAPINELKPDIPRRMQSIPVIINLIASIALVIDYIGIKRRWLRRLLSVIPSFIGAIILGAIRPETSIWMAFVATIVFPSLSCIVLLNSLKKSSNNIFILICVSLARLLFINGIGACMVIASMCDVRYTMGLVNFNLVIPALIIPLIAFNIYFVYILKSQHTRKKGKVDYYYNRGITKNLLSYIIYVIIVSVFIFVYIARSGNFDILPQFRIELEVRKFLELTMTARPRTKEFIIGYPSLFVFLYLYSQKVSYKLLSFFGTLSSITGISIINSFCHGFTPVFTSFNRTLNGLFLGTITGCMSLIVFKFYFESRQTKD